MLTEDVRALENGMHSSRGCALFDALRDVHRHDSKRASQLCFLIVGALVRKVDALRCTLRNAQRHAPWRAPLVVFLYCTHFGADVSALL